MFARSHLPQPRKALLVLDLQKEFLDPATGRCLLPDVSQRSSSSAPSSTENAPSAPPQPRFLKNIAHFVSRFREHNGDIIWVRSESKARRDFQDPRVEETIIIINDESDSGEESSGDDDDAAAATSKESKNGGKKGGNKGSAKGAGYKSNGKPVDKTQRPNPAMKKLFRTPSVKRGKVDVNGNGPSRPPLLTDAYLSIDTRFPPVAPQTPSSEWHEPVRNMMHLPNDRELTKSWYSAFKDTNLLETLRGRFVTELYLCGLMTNVSVLATAADAARHGLQVTVLSDCLGYRSEAAHERALDTMAEQLEVDHDNSMELLKYWDKQKAKRTKNSTAMPTFGDTGIDKEILAKMVEELKLTEAEAPDTPPPLAQEKQEKERGRGTVRTRAPVKARNVTRKVEGIAAQADKAAEKYNAAAQGEEQPEEQRNEKLEKEEEASDKRVEVRKQASGQGRVPSKVKLPTKVVQLEPEKSEEELSAPEKPTSEKCAQEENAESPSTQPAETPVATSQPTSPQRQSPEEILQAYKKERCVVPSAKVRVRKHASKFTSPAPVLGEGQKMGEGDTYLIKELLPENLAGNIFESLKREVAWRSMFHRGGDVPRLVAVQGDIDEDGSFPIYRHPSDESPPLFAFTPTVEKIRKHVEKAVGHPVNHVLIQHYRGGSDYISEHSDKTLDIAPDSKIVNVSIGAQRTMILRTKKDASTPGKGLQKDTNSVRDSQGNVERKPNSEEHKRTAQRVHLPHNSMFVLGLQTNMKWLHAINRDRRDPNSKSPEELEYDGERISLTFRQIGTFLSVDETEIWGQGATKKTKESPAQVVKGDSAAAEKLLAAFGTENHSSAFSRDSEYGVGFDVVHLVDPKPKLYARKNASPEERVEFYRVKIALAEKDVDYVEQILDETQQPALHVLNPRGTIPVFVDIDRDRSIVHDSMSILHYLEIYFPPASEDGPWLLPALREQRSAYVHTSVRIMESNRLLQAVKQGDKDEACRELSIWEAYIGKGRGYADGTEEYTLADVALFPVVKEARNKGWSCNVDGKRWPALDEWVACMESRDTVKKAYSTFGF